MNLTVLERPNVDMEAASMRASTGSCEIRMRDIGAAVPALALVS